MVVITLTIAINKDNQTNNSANALFQPVMNHGICKVQENSASIKNSEISLIHE